MVKSEKVIVKICVGTACFVQGGSDLLLYNDFLDPSVLAGCEIEGSSCLEMCKKTKDSVNGDEKPPFISINGKIYGGVTPDRFCKLLAEVVNA
jgi:NADH:ubiquinone oxidoreductase subunit E